MDNKKTVLMQWGIPFVFLLIIITAILINFSMIGHTRSTERIIEQKENETEEYAEKLYRELNLMTQAGIPVADVLGSIRDENTVIIQNLQISLCNNTMAYQVIYADENGVGKDQKGNKVDVSEESYFSPNYTEQVYAYVEEDCITGSSAIVSIIPVNHVNKKALYLYYPLERFQELYKSITYIKNSFCALVIEQGNIVASLGQNQKYVAGQNFYDLLLDSEMEEGTVQDTWTDIQQSKLKHFIIKDGTKKIFVTYAPTNIRDWYIVIGTDYSRINTLIKNDSKATQQVVTQLLIIIVAFILFVIVMSVINKMKYNKQSKTLELKADTDLLTQLYNKMATEREIKKYIQEHPNEKALFFLIDIDNFKKINDTMGHAFGDEVLRTVGSLLKVEFRQTDIVGRIGGDEMVIFLKNLPDEESMKYQMRKVAKFYKSLEIGEYVKYKVTASIGVTVYPGQGTDFATLYAKADKALYIAKGNGKDCLYCEKIQIEDHN